MGALIYIGCIILIIISFQIGKWVGKNETIKDSIFPGTWIEIKDDIILDKGQNNIIIRAGIQAIVTNKDKWERISIWIAKPWYKLYGDRIPEFHGITQYSKIKLLNPAIIQEHVKENTLKDLEKWEIDTAKFYSKIFPPGWLEIQNLLNRYSK